MTPTEAAILRTVLYGDVFDFALTVAEIHHFLIADAPLPYDEIEQVLDTSLYLQSVLDRERGFVVRAGRLELIPLRLRREEHAQRLWQLAAVYAEWLARLPFVRMVALTGALAMRNPSAPNDDLDYLLVTTPNRVWLARAFAVVLVRLVKLRGVVICPNYVLAETAMTQTRHDLFIAHELAQMIPFYDTERYVAMRGANHWVESWLPNAAAPFHAPSTLRVEGVWGAFKRLMETLLSGKLGDRLEQWEFERKARRFAGELKHPRSAARIDAEQVKGHFNDHGHPILEKYQERLKAYQLQALPRTGD